MSNRHDIHYGRQGGRIVDYAPPTGQRLCVVCGQPMTAGQKVRHHLCDPTSIVGRACTCPPGCTDITVGDTGTCDTACEVCRVMRGRVHADVVEWKPKRTNPASQETDDEVLVDDTQLSLFGEPA